MTATTPEVYGDLIKALLDAEATRKTSLEQRGSAIITTSGALVTLLFGLVAVVTGSKTFVLPSAAHGWLFGAILAFVVAAAIAILVSVPVPYGQTSLTTAELKAWWADPVETSQAAVAGVRLRAITAARTMNSVKAWLVIAASAAQLVAVALLAVAVIRILQGS